ncbi:diguanylate cyclase (GGDEF) domain-containing protein [Pseudomonas sp. 43mfcvi1.1]|uniref:putative bifunctional diguanylate cyclase/phosphodiesterase n=1 Tax=unclassified Pseudomonas TaxID=196821 RepID=UPI000D6C3560|nr:MULTISPECIES: EAL domain-containing protein [unclassified Pseudomonas]PWJ38882.1 diguanylate cyclase (GGDEF)-like protein [Pseudomonas sp. 43mfcvi1.1]QIB08169.1 EAL domain-containing protein [Pseudomonas fluorescens]SSB96146.1 diguanylate cyclase (GGDEF) domain-containing protein [Pseudomonas sp. 43mfcvi1.1]
MPVQRSNILRSATDIAHSANSVSVTTNSLFRRGFDQAKEIYILFPLLAVFLLLSIWAATLYLIKVEQVRAQQSAAAASVEIAATYEAQILRAVREIDQTLKLVKYTYESEGEQNPLPKLKARALLPPPFLFDVSVVDADGMVVASTQPSEAGSRVAQDELQTLRRDNVLSISRPWKNPVTGEWKLRFSRRLNSADGAFSGIAMVEVDAAYFVSSYDASKLGNQGTLGLLGTDGIFRVWRTGEVVLAGDAVDYTAVVPDNETTEAVLAINGWDGVRRYTSARQLYDYPLAIIVGLSEEEQLSAVNRQAHTYLWRAAGASLLLVLLVSLLSRMSWQLVQSRLRAAEAKIAYAERVEYLAYHDGLTSLPNRSLFSKMLSQSISEASRYHRQLAVLFLDLDRFKHINDTLGHDAGDQLLQEVAQRITACLRASDTVARLGGDEFVILLPELSEDKYVAITAQKVLSTIARPFNLQDHEFRVTASIGISVFPQDGLDEQTLKKNADIAMYQAKQQGKNNFQFYSEKLNADSLERLTLELSLRHALERQEFQLHYQAKRDIRSGQITGMEALLRWDHPDLGIVAPMQFIPIAEETGLIVPIGKWVLKTACLQNVAWQQQGLPHLGMAVNLTARQFADENLLTDLAAILAETGMEASLLELEIAESLLMQDVKRALSVLTGLKHLRIRIAIDDFGIGYSSLSALKQFPLDSIKIDRSFICDVTSVSEDKALTEAIIAMGRTLSLTVVAQGVETKEQADFLRENACDEFQGFYFNRPVPADQFTMLLQAQPG